jgi:chemotaxis protein methyltransferase CheR
VTTAPNLTNVDMQIDDAQFAHVSALITRHFGIQLPAHKRGLLQMRLRRVVIETGYSDFTAFYNAHVASKTPSLEILGRLIDRVSTNHTFFWRESEHFTHLRDVVLPELARGNSGDLRLWCAAAATGEEPWTLAMLVTEAMAPLRWQAGLLATDISARALETAQRGHYKPESATALPAALRDRWMKPGPDGMLRISDALRSEVTWRRLNLIGAPFAFKKAMDVVFCRNVMIYFDETTRRDVVHRIAQVTRPGGWLFIGHSETLGRQDADWRFERPGMYRRIA